MSACQSSPQRTERFGPSTGSVSGRQVFLSQCQGCHALGKLGSPRPVGGDLGNYDMTPAEVESFARIMPTPRRLSRSELAAVSSFVSSRQRRREGEPRAGGS
jgi:mono/diheme cytochrome c family protein